MRPETRGPWRRTIRREARGVPGPRRRRAPAPDAIRRGSTWFRRHQWMPWDELERTYASRRVAS